MKIASWNVNSIKARLANVVDWLKQAEPDVVCLQEIKTVDETFPSEAFEDLGYNVAVHGQKAYNGVALLSKRPLEDVRRGLPGDRQDDQARFIDALIPTDRAPVRVASLYLPNGNPRDSEKFPYKLKWMDRLIEHAKSLLEQEEDFVLAGDYNVIPTSDDVYDAKAWADDALFAYETRAKFYTLSHLGLTDAFRVRHAEPHLYTFWDYQRGAWPKDHGLRIDHLLLSPQATDRLGDCDVDAYVRGWDKPSDHVPIWCVLDE